MPTHILSMSKEDKKRFLESFDYVFSDIDGVATSHIEPIAGASEGYAALQDQGKKLVFVTNNSFRPMKVLMRIFEKLQINVDVNDIMYPPLSILNYLKSNGIKGILYVVGPKVLKEALKDGGYEVYDGIAEPDKKSTEKIIEEFCENQKRTIAAVVVDFNLTINLAQLSEAMNFLKSSKCPLLVGATDSIVPLGRNVSIYGPGPFVDLLTATTGRKATVLGKPGKDLGDLLGSLYKIENPRRVLMIGDSLEQDIAFGKVCNFQTLAVLTGNNTLEDVLAAKNPDFIPDFYASSMGDFSEFINDINKIQSKV